MGSEMCIRDRRLAARVPHRDGQPHLRLRRLSGRLSVEQVRARRVGGAAAGARRAEVAAAGGPAGAGRPRLPRPVRQESGQADRPRPVHSQCPVCGGQFRGRCADRAGRGPAGRPRPRGARRGDLGAVASFAGTVRGRARGAATAGNGRRGQTGMVLLPLREKVAGAA